MDYDEECRTLRWEIRRLEALNAELMATLEEAVAKLCAVIAKAKGENK